MRLTPLDIQNHRFPNRMRGYDSQEVDDFLRMIAHDYETMLTANEKLKDHVRKLENRVKELSGNEEMLREAIITAQTMSEDLKRTAIRESEIMVGQAEIRAEKIIAGAQTGANRLSEQIRELKALRGRLTSEIKTTIETHLALVGALSEDGEESEDPIVQGKVTFLEPTGPRDTGTDGNS